MLYESHLYKHPSSGLDAFGFFYIGDECIPVEDHFIDVPREPFTFEDPTKVPDIVVIEESNEFWVYTFCPYQVRMDVLKHATPDLYNELSCCCTEVVYQSPLFSLERIVTHDNKVYNFVSYHSSPIRCCFALENNEVVNTTDPELTNAFDRFANHTGIRIEPVNLVTSILTDDVDNHPTN